MKTQVLILLNLLLVLSARGAAQGTNIYDSGFRPEVNGFSFENYGNEVQTVGMTPIEMHRMFGDQAFISIRGNNYSLTPPARAWMEEANKAMEYGHCEGLAVLSALMYFNQSNPSKFGGNETSKLSLQNELLQREIAYWWVTQVTHPGGTHRLNDSPNVVMDTLANAFKDGRAAKEWWTLGLYQPDGSGGHDITPIAAENFSNGSARILVYDNNFPKVTKTIEIDQKANTWKYHTSSNPNDPSELYTGNASTKSLEIVSIPPRLLRQDCDFCDNSSSSGLAASKGTKGALAGQKKVVQFWVDGDARIVVTDENGRRIGYLGEGDFVNEIPSASAIHLKYMDHPGAIHRQPVIIVPQGNTSARLTGINATDPDLTVIGSNYYASVQNLDLNPNEYVDLVVNQVGDEYIVELHASGIGSPRSVTLNLGVTITVMTPHGPEIQGLEFSIIGANLDPSGSVIIHYKPVELQSKLHTLTFETMGNSNPGQFHFQITGALTNGNMQLFANEDIHPPANSVVTMHLDSENLNSIEASVQSGDKTTPTPYTLTNNYRELFQGALPGINYCSHTGQYELVRLAPT